MSDELKKLRNVVQTMGGHLQDLQAEQKATTRDLKTLTKTVQRLESRSTSMEASLTALGGTFASIEQILTDLITDRDRLDSVEQTMVDLARRVEALENRAS